tara:strand:+ start:59 stop:730 length:672 start_codon:yes stop_codon:yes gene_type:complete
MLRPKKKITRKEIQRDPFLESVDQAQAHLEKNRSLYLKIAIGIIVALLFFNIRSNRQTQYNIEASASLGKALVTLDQGDKSSAKFQLETVYNDFNGTSSAYTASYYLGKIKYDAGENLEAERYLSSFLKKNRKDPLAHSAVLMLADISVNQDKISDAIDMIDKGLKNSSKYDSRTLKLMKARILLDHKKVNESNLIIESILDEDGLSADHKQLAQELQGKIVS